MNDIGAALARFPRTRLLHLATPLEPMKRLGAALGLTGLMVKRDDCTGLAGGGNKTRKLEYEIGAALREGADTLVTTGAIQSNHARQTAGFAARLGLKCHLVLRHAVESPSREYLESGNVLLDKLFGAVIHQIPQPVAHGSSALRDHLSSFDEGMEKAASGIRASGGRPYIIGVGASSATGALGYVECAAELAAQAEATGGALDWVVHASGSCGTQAGLLAGFKAMGVATRVLGIAVSGTDQDSRRALAKSLTQETLQLLGSTAAVDDDDVLVNGDYVGDGYGLFDAATRDAVFAIARNEGLLVDPVYTGKALAGLIGLARKGAFQPGARVAYLHTGGWPGLFAYTALLS